MDYEVRAHDRVTYTNDLHGELVLKMIQLKERVEALEKLKAQRISELGTSESRVKRLQQKVQELELENEELVRENEGKLMQRKEQTEVEIASEISRQSELQVEKNKLVAIEHDLGQRRVRNAGKSKYETEQLEDKTQAEIQQKIGFLREEASISAELLKSEYIRDEEELVVGKLLQEEINLKSSNAEVILTSLSRLGDLSVERAVESIIESKDSGNTVPLQVESLDSQFLRVIEKKEQHATQCDDFGGAKEEKLEIEHFGEAGSEVGLYKQLEITNGRKQADTAPRGPNAACQIEQCSQDGRIVSRFRQVVEENSEVDVPAPRISVKYLTDEEKASGNWIKELNRNEQQRRNERDFAMFQQLKRGEEASKTIVDEINDRDCKTPQSFRAASPAGPYETPQNLTNIGYSELVADAFSPEQERALEASIRKQIAVTYCAESRRREKAKSKAKRSTGAQLALQRRQLESSVATLRNEHNGLRKRLERLQFDKGGDAQLRHAHISQIKQLITANANESKAVKERLARVLIMQQLDK